MQGEFQASGRVRLQGLVEFPQLLALFQKNKASGRVFRKAQRGADDFPPFLREEIRPPGDDPCGAWLVEKVPLIAVIDAKVSPRADRTLIMDRPFQVAGLDQADNLFVLREPFEHGGADIVPF
jgi:hypothetical protein